VNGGSVCNFSAGIKSNQLRFVAAVMCTLGTFQRATGVLAGEKVATYIAIEFDRITWSDTGDSRYHTDRARYYVSSSTIVQSKAITTSSAEDVHTLSPQ